MHTSEKDKYVQAFSKIAEKSLGHAIPNIGKNGACDLRHYPDTAGFEFGPIGAGPHSDTEWISIKSLDVYYKILKDFLLSLNN